MKKNNKYNKLAFNKKNKYNKLNKNSNKNKFNLIKMLQ